MKLKINLTQDISYEHFEEIIVSALEGGSNYWYLLKTSEFKAKLEGDSNEPLTTRIARTLYNDPTFEMKVYDVEEDDGEPELGIVSQATMLEGIQIAAEKYAFAYHDLMEGQGDGGTADVLFQLATMGEIIYG